MALKIKNKPKALKNKPFEFIWPQDDAVDIANSDIPRWCREGGRNGLALIQGKEPDVILLRRLTSDEVDALDLKAGLSKMSFAARLGLVDVPGYNLGGRVPDPMSDVLLWSKPRLDVLRDAYRMDLPTAYLFALEAEARGGKVDWELVSAACDELDICHAMGAQIIAATFRRRRDHA